MEDDSFDTQLSEIKIRKKKTFTRGVYVGEGGSIAGNPALFRNSVIFGAGDGFVFSVDKDTGKELWRFRTNGPIIFENPLIDDDRVFIGSYDGFFYCLDASSGELIWKFRTGEGILTQGTCDFANVYVPSMDNNVYCLDKITGKEKWRFTTGGWVFSPPKIYEGNILFGSYDNFIYCLDSETGGEIWRFRAGGEFCNDDPMPVKDGILYAPSFDNNLYAVDTRTGAEKWRFPCGKYGITGTPVFYDYRIYLGVRDGIVFCIGLGGNEIWRYRAEGLVVRVEARDDKIFFGDEKGNFYILDTCGNEIKRMKFDGAVYTKPLFTEDRMYVGSWDCHLYCLEHGSMNILWRFATSNPKQTVLPPAYEAFEAEVVVNGDDLSDAMDDDKYSGISVNLLEGDSEYSGESEYSGGFEYAQRGEYG